MATVRMRFHQKVTAVAILQVIALSLVVANVRERDRGRQARKSPTVGFGWPLVAYRQPVVYRPAELIDEDFPGGYELIPIRRWPARDWASIRQPVSELDIAYLLVDLLVLAVVFIGTWKTAKNWALHGARWSLSDILIWMTCVTLIFAQLCHDQINDGWWNPSQTYGASWIEIVNTLVLATGCTAALSYLVKSMGKSKRSGLIE